jgi:hypothetical protein
MVLPLISAELEPTYGRAHVAGKCPAAYQIRSDPGKQPRENLLAARQQYVSVPALWDTLRASGASTGTSLSSSVTCSKYSESTRAANSPAILPPMTIACLIAVGITFLYGRHCSLDLSSNLSSAPCLCREHNDILFYHQ